MELVKSGLNIEQISYERRTYIDKCIFGTDTNVLNSDGRLNFEWSLQLNLCCISFHKVRKKTIKNHIWKLT